MSRFSTRVAGAIAGIGAGVALLSATGPTTGAAAPIHADFWYDVSDPALVAGEAAFAVVGTVERKVREEDHRTIFEVRVVEELYGSVPSVVRVSQMGYTAQGSTIEVDGFALMEAGRTYILALTAPAPEEPQDALLLLTAQGEGNRLEVVSADDEQVAAYRDVLAGARSPYSAGDTYDRTAQHVRRWAQERGGFDTRGLRRPGMGG